MQLALSTTITPPPVPVWGELSQNSCQGFAAKNQSWNPGPNVVNSTTAIGLQAGLLLKGFGQSHSARYYNPATGRFMSRDPHDGDVTVPFTLHKYVYAAANPIYWRDPSGRDLFEYAFQQSKAIPATAYLNTFGCIASIGFAAAASELDVWGVGGVVTATYGCVSSFIWPGGVFAEHLKTVLDWGACAFGLIQAVNDINQYAQHQNVSNETFYTDAFGGVIGCAVTHLGSVIGGGKD